MPVCHRQVSRTVFNEIFLVLDTIPPKSGITRTDEKLSSKTNFTQRVKNRIDCHRNGSGAVFTKKYNVTILIYFEVFDDFNDAFKREKQLKNWHKNWKWNMVKFSNPELKDLYLNL